MGSNVTDMFGNEVDPRVSAEQVVKAVSRILEQAQSGEVVGVAVAMIHADDTTSYTFRGDTGRALIGALDLVKADLVDLARGIEQ